jgi:hypothetical protein
LYFKRIIHFSFRLRPVCRISKETTAGRTLFYLMTAKTTAAVTVTVSVIKVVAAISAAATPKTPVQIPAGGSASVTFFQLEGVCRFPVLPGITSTGLGENYRSHSHHNQG